MYYKSELELKVKVKDGSIITANQQEVPCGAFTINTGIKLNVPENFNYEALSNNKLILSILDCFDMSVTRLIIVKYEQCQENDLTMLVDGPLCKFTFETSLCALIKAHRISYTGLEITKQPKIGVYTTKESTALINTCSVGDNIFKKTILAITPKNFCCLQQGGESIETYDLPLSM